MYWWVTLWLCLGIVACLGVLYVVLEELMAQSSEMEKKGE
jgi:hypothetical protein